MVDPKEEDAAADTKTEEMATDAVEEVTKAEDGAEKPKADEEGDVKAEDGDTNGEKTVEEKTEVEKVEEDKAAEEPAADSGENPKKKGKATPAKGKKGSAKKSGKATTDDAKTEKADEAKAEEGDETAKKEDETDKKEGEDVEMKDAPAKYSKKRKSKAPPVETLAVKRERRERKSVESFDPNDFDKASTAVVVRGRGNPLRDLAKTKAAIENAHVDDILLAYRLLFDLRARAAKNEMITSLLAFSGYLPPLKKGASKEVQHEIDEEFEVKWGDKAYKLGVPQLRKLMDLFSVDRSDYKGKDSLVDALLDFLGEPDEEKMKGTTAQKKDDYKSWKGKKSDADDKEQETREYDDVDEDKLQDSTPNELPSDDALRKWVRAYVRCHNMKKSSVKDAIRIASEKFDVDISSQKARLKELLTEEI